MPAYSPTPKQAVIPKGRVILSTWPFADGFPWDEELIHSGQRALSTHGPSKHLEGSKTS